MSSSRLQTNTLGLSGVPPQPPDPLITTESDPPEHARTPSIPLVTLESPDSVRRTTSGPPELGSRRGSASETDLRDTLRERDTLSALPSQTTFPRRDTSASNPFPQRSATHPSLDDLGRRSTESEPTPRHSKESPRLSVKEAISARFGGRISDPGHAPRASSPPRNSPRWPFMPLHLTRSRQEAFLPEDPYSRHGRGKLLERRWVRHLSRQFVRHFLLRLPSTYFTRVRRVFEGAAVSKNEIQQMIMERDDGAPFPYEWTSETVAPSILRFRTAWEEFIDSVMREWKTLNIVSALLTTGILTLFQIPDASNNPYTRTFSLMSMICALMSLIYGCTYILRFGTMRGMDKALRWAEEMERTRTAIFWNVWILLATPAVWLAYSMIFFCGSILSFVWTTGTSSTPKPLSERAALAPRLIMTLLFFLGLVVFGAVISTFRSWGNAGVQRRRREIAHSSPVALPQELKGNNHRGRDDGTRQQ